MASPAYMMQLLLLLNKVLETILSISFIFFLLFFVLISSTLSTLSTLLNSSISSILSTLSTLLTSSVSSILSILSTLLILSTSSILSILSSLSTLSASIFTTCGISYRAQLWSNINYMTAQDEAAMPEPAMPEPATPEPATSWTPREASTEAKAEPSNYRSANLPSPEKPTHPFRADPRPPYHDRLSVYTGRRRNRFMDCHKTPFISERWTPGIKYEAADKISRIPPISTSATPSPYSPESSRLEEPPTAGSSSEHSEDAGSAPAPAPQNAVLAKPAAAALRKGCLVTSSAETRRPQTVKRVRIASPVTSSPLPSPALPSPALPAPAYTAPCSMGENVNLPTITHFPQKLRGQAADWPRSNLHRKSAARDPKPKAPPPPIRMLSPHSRRLAKERAMKKPAKRIGLTVNFDSAQFVALADGGSPDQETTQATDDQEWPTSKEAAQPDMDWRCQTPEADRPHRVVEAEQTDMDWRCQTPEVDRPERPVEAAPRVEEDADANRRHEERMAKLIDQMVNFHIETPDVAEPQQPRTADPEMQGMNRANSEAPRMAHAELQDVHMEGQPRSGANQFESEDVDMTEAPELREQEMEARLMQEQEMEARLMQEQQLKSQQMQQQLQAQQMQQQLQAQQWQEKLQAQRWQEQLQAQRWQEQQAQQLQAHHMHLQQMQALRPQPSQVEVQDVSMAEVQQPQVTHTFMQYPPTAQASLQKVNAQNTVKPNQEPETKISEGGLLAGAAQAYEQAQKEMSVQKMKEAASTALFSGLSEKEIAIRAEGRRRNPGAKADHEGNML